MKDLASKARSHPHIAIAGAVVLTLIVLYLIAHQLSSTGFFTATCTFEMLLLYGSLIEWIVVAVLEVLWILVNLGAAVYYPILRVAVRKARVRKIF